MKCWKNIALFIVAILLLLFIAFRLSPITGLIFWAVHVLDIHNGLVTAIATVFVAGFTWTLWRSNKSIIEQAQATADLAQKQFLMEGKQADLAERQHGLARLQFIAANRPIIEIRSVALQASGKGGKLFHRGGPIKGSLVIRNMGGSDAKILEAEYRFYSSSDGLPMVPPLQKGTTKSLFPNLPEIVVAHGSHEAPVEGEPLYGEAVDHIDMDPRNSQGWKVWVLGAIRYSDISENERWMGFCREYVPTNRDVGEGRFVAVTNTDYEYQD